MNKENLKIADPVERGKAMAADSLQLMQASNRGQLHDHMHEKRESCASPPACEPVSEQASFADGYEAGLRDGMKIVAPECVEALRRFVDEAKGRHSFHSVAGMVFMECNPFCQLMAVGEAALAHFIPSASGKKVSA